MSKFKRYKNKPMKNRFTFSLIMLAALCVRAQSPRISLYEEFTGETCPPCAATNPGLNTKLLSATNATRIVAIKWQVPIPSAPSNTWSLYKTDMTEIDWRWKSVSNNGYGYIPAINSAPSSKIDGREATVFGATSGHPTYLNDNVITNAVNVPSSFNIIMTRDPITNMSTAAVVNVTIQATAPYATTGNLVFRNVLVERLIQFSVQPGTNGETKFEDAARKSYPTLQNGTPLPQNWTRGQIMTFSMNCVFPSYIHDNLEIEFVGFIQNDLTQRVEQVCRTGLPVPAFDAAASSVNPPFTCSASNTMAPIVPVKNNGASDITALTITPYVDGVAKAPTQWTGVIHPGFSDFVQLNAFTSASTSGTHTFSYTISGLNNTETFTSNNGAQGSYYGVYSYAGTPISEGFMGSAWPYAGWLLNNADGGAATWSYATGIEAYAMTSGNCLEYNFYKNSVINDKDEILLPPVDLTGPGQPQMSFDIAFKLRMITSNDKLEVMVSDDCGTTWHTAWSASGAGLAVDPTPMPGEYYNPVFEDWINFAFPLTGYNKTGVLVKLVATNGYGNNLYLDNINLAANSVADGIKENAGNQTAMNVSPNPGSGLTNVLITSAKAQVASLTVVNALGMVIMNKQVNLSAGKNNSIIDLSGIATGIYSIHLSGNNLKAVTKIIVSH
jgi:hypothetical protein